MGKNSIVKGAILIVWILVALLSTVAGCFCHHWPLLLASIFSLLVHAVVIVSLYFHWKGKENKILTFI